MAGMDHSRLSAEEKIVISGLKDALKKIAGDRFKMILFGSKARGDYSQESDVDIAIIIPGLTRKLKDKILDEVAEIELQHLMPLSTLVISEDDFVFLKKRERRIALDIEKEGIPL